MVLEEQRIKSFIKAMGDLKKLEKEYKAATTDQDKAKITKLAKELEFTANFALNTLGNELNVAWRELHAASKALGL